MIVSDGLLLRSILDDCVSESGLRSVTHYSNDSASHEWLREMAMMETGRDELEPHQVNRDFAAGCAESFDVFDPALPAVIRRQAE